MKDFVTQSADVYGEHFITFNIHNFIHVPFDVEYFMRVLYDFSCYPTENYLQILKGMILSKRFMLEQGVKRIDEIHRNVIAMKNKHIDQPFVSVSAKTHTNGPMVHPLHGSQHAKVIIGSNLQFSRKKGDNVAYMKNREIIYILNILKTNSGEVFFIGKTFSHVTDLFTTPTLSRNIHTYLVSALKPLLTVRKVDEVWMKLCILPAKRQHEGCYVVSPLSLRARI